MEVPKALPIFAKNLEVGTICLKSKWTFAHKLNILNQVFIFDTWVIIKRYKI